MWNSSEIDSTTEKVTYEDSKDKSRHCQRRCTKVYCTFSYSTGL